MEKSTLQQECVAGKEETLEQLKKVYHKRDFIERLNTMSAGGDYLEVIKLANQIRLYLLEESRP